MGGVWRVVVMYCFIFLNGFGCEVGGVIRGVMVLRDIIREL